MDYKEALAACLESMREGQDREQAIAAYPEHAEQLRNDIALTEAVRAYASNLAQPSVDATERAQQRLNSQLSTLRAQRRAPSPSRAFWRMPMLQGLAFAVVAILAIGFLALAGGVFGGAQTAEADTIDGVVVESTADSIVVQTENGLKTVALDQESNITDENGTTVDVGSIEAGQVIVVRVKRLPKGLLRAIAVQRRPLGALEAWCKLHPLRCQEVEPKLPPAALGCQTDSTRCTQPTPAAGSTPSRLQNVSERCQQNGGAACEELRTYCRNNIAACTGITGWLRTFLDLPDDVRERVRIQTQRCQSGSILDCRELRLFCERNAQACPAVTPRRPAIQGTPRRPF